MNHLTTMRLSQCFMILKLAPSVTWEDVKKSYHSLAKQYHPDFNPRDTISENKFKELTSAFRFLEVHYQKPKQQRQQTFASIRPKSPSAARPVSAEVNTEEPNSSFPETPAKEKQGGWVQWVHSFRGGFNKIERKIFLLDTLKNIRVAPHTATHGGIIRLHSRKETFQVKIPSGGWNRMSLRVKEKGESSLFGKKRGDLVLNIQVIKPEQLDAGRSKFFYELHISREKIKSSKVQTLNSVQGPIKFVLPRGTKDGHTFVLKYQAKAGTSSSPDHVVKVHLV